MPMGSALLRQPRGRARAPAARGRRQSHAVPLLARGSLPSWPATRRRSLPRSARRVVAAGSDPAVTPRRGPLGQLAQHVQRQALFGLRRATTDGIRSRAHRRHPAGIAPRSRRHQRVRARRRARRRPARARRRARGRQTRGTPRGARTRRARLAKRTTLGEPQAPAAPSRLPPLPLRRVPQQAGAAPCDAWGSGGHERARALCQRARSARAGGGPADLHADIPLSAV